MPKFIGVSHVGLTVRDVDRSAAWYERVLGLQLLGEFPQFATPGVAARVVHLHTPAEIHVALIQHESGEDGEFSEFRVGLDHLALAVASRDELEQWVEHLDGCEVPHSGIRDMRYGGSVVVLRDPDNIQLELFTLAIPSE
jgi:catechol 2,3-dioxygenase-like lactoylglutathione lyase family enzyme